MNKLSELARQLGRENGTHRARTPTVLQMEAVECGAAALGSILGYHGRIVPLEELRVECGVSRDGVTAKNVVHAARRYGLEAKGWKKELASLRGMRFPVMLFWNFNHFLVLEGFGKGKAWINDPAFGPRTVSEEELDEAYTGVVLTFQPRPDFVRGGKRPSLVQAVRSRLTGSGSVIAFVALGGLALVIPGLVIPAFARIFVDDILVTGMRSWVRPLLLGMLLTALLRGGVTLLRERALLRLENKLAVTTSKQFFWHVLRLPMSFYAQRWAGEVSARVALTDEVARLMSGRLASTIIDLLMVVFFAALMLTYDVALTLVGMVMVGANLLLMRSIGRARADGNRRLLQEEGKFLGAVMGGMQNIETVKATSRESDLFAVLAGYQAKLVRADQDLAVRTLWLTSAPPFLTAFAQIAVLALGGLRVMQGELTMGMLVAFQSLMSSFTAPANALVDLGANLQEMEGNMNRLDDVLRHPIDPRLEAAGHGGNGRGGNARPVPVTDRLAGRVEIKNVTFGYSRLAPPLIRNFSLVVEPGHRVALVGRSGSGKSTISKLVCQLYEPWEGEILLDGRPAREHSPDVLAASIAFVDQDLFLFEGTLRENLTLWDDTIPEPEMLRAARDAEIYDDVVARLGGFDSAMGETGANFSGGQRQRLDIARALAGGPRLLVLDEATSALDPVTEQRIDENLRSRGCTCVIVAHRLSTIRDADEIIVLDAGKVVQRGTHDDLIRESDGAYALLVEG